MIAQRLKKVNDLSGYETLPGPPIPVFIIGDDDTPDTNVQTGTAYTLQLSDRDQIVQTNSGSGVTLTVPPEASVAFPIGSIVGLYQYGAGTLTVAGGSGVTVRSLGGNLALSGQYAEASLRKIAANEWQLTGALA